MEPKKGVSDISHLTTYRHRSYPVYLAPQDVKITIESGHKYLALPTAYSVQIAGT